MNAFFETTNGFNLQIIEPLIESRGVRLTWFDCKANWNNRENVSKNATIHFNSDVFAAVAVVVANTP